MCGRVTGPRAATVSPREGEHQGSSLQALSQQRGETVMDADYRRTSERLRKEIEAEGGLQWDGRPSDMVCPRKCTTIPYVPVSLLTLLYCVALALRAA